MGCVIGGVTWHRRLRQCPVRRRGQFNVFGSDPGRDYWLAGVLPYRRRWLDAQYTGPRSGRRPK